MSGYFDLTLTASRAAGLRHTLNRHYRGTERFSFRAPDAAGELTVWARSAQEAEAHCWNALFDLLFSRHRLGIAPACPVCGGEGAPRGRNSVGRRQWRCENPECRRWFGAERNGHGGVAHPIEERRHEFYCLVFCHGRRVPEACAQLRISRSAGYAWRRRYLELMAKWNESKPEE